MNECDFPLERVEQYAMGLSDEAEAIAVERHVARCTGCESRLNTLLSPTAELVRQSVTESSPGRHVEGRVFGKRARWSMARSGLVAGSLLAASLAALFWPRAEQLPVSGLNGIILADDRRLVGGASLSDGTVLRFLGPGELRSGALRIVSNGSYNEFTLRRDGHGWSIRDPASDLSFVHVGGAPSYSVSSRGRRYLPQGTRFRVWPDTGRVDVFESRLVLESKDGAMTCVAGSSVTGGRATVVRDDPTASLIQPLPRSVFKALPSTPVSDVGEELPRILASRSEHSHWAAADWFVERGLLRDAMVCARLAMERGTSQPAGATQLVPALAPSADPESARALLARCKGAAVDPTWTLTTLDVPFQDRRRALRRLMRSEALFGSLCAAEALLKATLDWTGPNANRTADLAAVATRLRELSRERSERASNWTMGRLWATLAEAEYYLGNESSSLHALELSVQAQPTPSRIVHLCARRSEVGNPTDADRTLLLEAFAADRSYVAAERVLTFMRDTVKKREDVEGVYDFARWIGTTYSSVMDAQFLAAKHLMYAAPHEALAFAESGFSLAKIDPSALRFGDRAVLATLRYQALPAALRGPSAARALASSCGLDSAAGDPALARFYGSIGLLDHAIDAIEAARLSPLEAAEIRASLLDEAGAESSTQADCATIYSISRRQSWEHADYLARIALASQLGDARYLREISDHGWADARRGWRRATDTADSLAARDLWARGRATEAIALLRATLTRWHDLDAPEQVRARFQLWQPGWESGRRRLGIWLRSSQNVGQPTSRR